MNVIFSLLKGNHVCSSRDTHVSLGKGSVRSYKNGWCDVQQHHDHEKVIKIY